MDKSTREAMELFAMLNGGAPVVPNEDAILDEAVRIETGKAPSKKKKNNKTVESKPVNTGLLPTCTFAKLANSGEMTVFFKEHYIQYKEQQWPVPDRTVRYEIKLITTVHEAKRISEIVSNNSAKEKEEAAKGLIRYYKVVAAENVNNDVTTIAYVKVVNVKGAPSFMILTNNGVLKKYNANIEDVSYELKRKMLTMIKKIKA